LRSEEALRLDGPCLTVLALGQIEDDRMGVKLRGNVPKRAAQSKVVKMMVSSEGTKAAILGTTDSRKQAQNAG